MSALEASREGLVAAMMTHGNQKAAAEAVGISPATASNWLKEPSTLELIREARRDLLSGILAETRKHLTASVNVLAEVQGDAANPASARVAAARSILDVSERLADQMETQERIAQIERRLDGRTTVQRPGAKVMEQ